MHLRSERLWIRTPKLLYARTALHKWDCASFQTFVIYTSVKTDFDVTGQYNFKKKWILSTYRALISYTTNAYFKFVKRYFIIFQMAIVNLYTKIGLLFVSGYTTYVIFYLYNNVQLRNLSMKVIIIIKNYLNITHAFKIRQLKGLTDCYCPLSFN